MYFVVVEEGGQGPYRSASNSDLVLISDTFTKQINTCYITLRDYLPVSVSLSYRYR